MLVITPFHRPNNIKNFQASTVSYCDESHIKYTETTGHTPQHLYPFIFCAHRKYIYSIEQITHFSSL